MKKTVALLALSASSSAFALTRPIPPQDMKTICLAVYENENGVMRSAGCDSARNNLASGTPLLENGCAEGQISLTAVKWNGSFDINIRSCMPPMVVQL